MLLLTFMPSTFFQIIGESFSMSLCKVEVFLVPPKFGFFRLKIFFVQFQSGQSAGVSIFAHFLTIILVLFKKDQSEVNRN